MKVREPAETSAENRAAKEPPVRDKEKKEEESKGMRYRLVGPYRGGRSLTASGVPGDPNTYYFGSTGGGVWKSTDGALSWKAIFNHEGSSSIGSIAVSPSDHNIVYVGSGEACIRGNISSCPTSLPFCTTTYSPSSAGPNSSES